ncbi:hypothetical protein Fsol_00501 [Candidatus Fokinia solitaria]|uniref:Uncharacterized protein n=1 Tax=Candidatus Fokinia solitaria TaxID=1802984 RepID=A0A2U8BSL2_9RICK|nr:hypothetical protein Fsol_00501 [Candidatus Fokinia solitaria]
MRGEWQYAAYKFYRSHCDSAVVRDKRNQERDGKKERYSRYYK